MDKFKDIIKKEVRTFVKWISISMLIAICLSVGLYTAMLLTSMTNDLYKKQYCEIIQKGEINNEKQ